MVRALLYKPPSCELESYSYLSLWDLVSLERLFSAKGSECNLSAKEKQLDLTVPHKDIFTKQDNELLL